MTKILHPRAGYTLIELLVVTTILAIGLGVVTGAILRESDRDNPRDAWSERLDRARARAVAVGDQVVVWPDSLNLEPMLFLPDGRSLGSAGAPPGGGS